MLNPTPSTLFFSKNDSQDPRLGELSKAKTFSDLASSSEEFVIVGYPDDEGIRINGGRPGAALAPDQIRSSFYKMTPSVFSQKTTGVSDLGNLEIEGVELAERHQRARTIAREVLRNRNKLLSLGGGHDFGYSDGAAFIEATRELQSSSKNKPIIFNFDAHLDVRSTEKGPTSGTPFFRLLTEFPGEFDLVEVGIQPQCNSRNHLRWAEEQGAQIISLEEIQHKGLLNSIKPWLSGEPLRPCFLSVDIDGFPSSEAPGCSQSWTTGIKTLEFLEVLHKLPQHFDVLGMGIYEVSPPLDSDHRTSKLAALLLHHFIHLF
jgi:formiminoglutamase